MNGQKNMNSMEQKHFSIPHFSDKSSDNWQLGVFIRRCSASYGSLPERAA
jgi:hypothetical protein